MPEPTQRPQSKRPRDAVVRVGTNVTTLAGIESLYDALGVRQPQDRVSLPTQARGLAAGGEAALIQWLATWVQGGAPLQLQTFATNAQDV